MDTRTRILKGINFDDINMKPSTIMLSIQYSLIRDRSQVPKEGLVNACTVKLISVHASTKCEAYAFHLILRVVKDVGPYRYVSIEYTNFEGEGKTAMKLLGRGYR